ncbi:MAG TPA: HD domain-containing phosphohydrolase [Tepidisphaeraceae bacterium]|nr:HD domain-containing phosphohydrolase [Tepidisphaeraceae bacterium]
MNIVIAEDSPLALKVLRDALVAAGHTVIATTNGQDALDAISEGGSRLVISDWEMPVLDGLQLCQAIRTSALPAYVYFILLTGNHSRQNKLEALAAGIDDFITKPFDQAELTLKLRIVERLLSTESREMVIFALAKLTESRDSDTGLHLERVQHYTRFLARDLDGRQGFPEVNDAYVNTIFLTSPLHDIGKAAIPDHVLLKPGKLTPEEFDIMKSHTTLGARTLKTLMERYRNASYLQMAYQIALTHHERFDGKGYPNGIQGREIPLCGRIMTICDCYDALTSQRVYKPAFDHKKACGIIREESGTHFDPELVAAFDRVESQFDAVRIAYKDHHPTEAAA